MTMHTTEIVPVGTTNIETEVITPVVQAYLDRYNSAMRKTAKAVLEVATTLLDAKQQLGQVDLRIFLDNIGFNPDSSTYKKFLVIAERKLALEAHVECLPNAWTTIYKLAKLDADQLETVALSGQLTPFATAKTIDTLIAGNSSNTTARAVNDIFISAQSLTPEQQVELHNNINALCAQYNASVRFSNTMVKTVATHTQKAA